MLFFAKVGSRCVRTANELFSHFPVSGCAGTMVVGRHYKLRSLFVRVTGHLQSGILSELNKPIWYDVYKNFPPHFEPNYNRPAPDTEVKNIMYEEDRIRAVLHKSFLNNIILHLEKNKPNSLTKMYIKNCQDLMMKENITLDEAVQKLKEQKSFSRSKKSNTVENQ